MTDYLICVKILIPLQTHISIGRSISRRALVGQVISDGHQRHGSLDQNHSVRHRYQSKSLLVKYLNLGIVLDASLLN